MNKTSEKNSDNVIDIMQKMDILIKNHIISREKLFSKEIDNKQIEKLFFQFFDQKLESDQSQFLLETLSPIYATKDYHKKLMELARRTMEITLKSISNRNYKKQKTEKEINRIKRKLNKCWKDVQKSDNNVMISTNSLLKSIESASIDLEPSENKYEFRKERKKYGRYWLYDNMGFSEDDGFSEKPSGKIDILIQGEVFCLIASLLDWHVRVTTLFFCQLEFFRAIGFESISEKKTLYDTISDSFQKVIPRKECFEIIIDVLKESGISRYSKSYILKQLSNWNTNKIFITKKGKKRGPLIGYEKARRGSKDDFRVWVKGTYLQYFINKKEKGSLNQKKREPLMMNKKQIDQNDDE